MTPADVERFWGEIVPAIGARNRDFDTMPDVVAELRARYSRKELRIQQRLLARFALLLVARLEPLYLGRGGKPLIPAETNFHLWLLAHHMIGKGKDAYLAALANPPGLAAELKLMTAQTGIYYFALFRYESMVFDAQKARLLLVLSAPYDEQKKREALAEKPEDMVGLRRTFDRILRAVSGYYGIAREVHDGFKGPRFDLGYPELYPSFRELPTGEVVVGEYAKPPAGIEENRRGVEAEISAAKPFGGLAGEPILLLARDDHHEVGQPAQERDERQAQRGAEAQIRELVRTEVAVAERL